MSDLERLSRELQDAHTPRHRAEIHRLVDSIRDEQLSERGAHVPACRCDECSAQLGRFRHLGECTHPDDVASEGW